MILKGLTTVLVETSRDAQFSNGDADKVQRGFKLQNQLRYRQSINQPIAEAERGESRDSSTESSRFASSGPKTLKIVLVFDTCGTAIETKSCKIRLSAKKRENSRDDTVVGYLPRRQESRST